MAIFNTTSGKISNLYSLEDKSTATLTSKPVYETFGAVLLDSNDSIDGKPYLYSSFLMD